jgi:hypothetical protein
MALRRSKTPGWHCFAGRVNRAPPISAVLVKVSLTGSDGAGER